MARKRKVVKDPTPLTAWPPWPTHARVLPEPFMFYIVGRLCGESCWFMVTPLPDGLYEIAVREDRAPTLNQLADVFKGDAV